MFIGNGFFFFKENWFVKRVSLSVWRVADLFNETLWWVAMWHQRFRELSLLIRERRLDPGASSPQPVTPHGSNIVLSHRTSMFIYSTVDKVRISLGDINHYLSGWQWSQYHWLQRRMRDAEMHQPARRIVNGVLVDPRGLARNEIYIIDYCTRRLN